jgi:hypothetical protein
VAALFEDTDDAEKRPTEANGAGEQCILAGPFDVREEQAAQPKWRPVTAKASCGRSQTKRLMLANGAVSCSD